MGLVTRPQKNSPQNVVRVVTGGTLRLHVEQLNMYMNVYTWGKDIMETGKEAVVIRIMLIRMGGRQPQRYAFQQWVN